MYETTDPQQPPQHSTAMPTPGSPPPLASQHQPSQPPGVPVLPYRMPGSADPFLPVRGRANLASACLVAWVLWSGLSLLSSYWQLELLRRAQVEGISQAEATANDQRESLIGAVSIALYIGCAVLFLMWLSRVRKNLPALGVHDAQHSPGWAIGGWFVPILNLFRPYQVVREIERASSPYARRERRAWQDAPGSAVVGWWWAAWIVAIVASRVAQSVGRKAREVPELIRATMTEMASVGLSVVAALLCVGVMRRISAHQEQAAGIAAGEVSSAGYAGGADAAVMPEYPRA